MVISFPVFAKLLDGIAASVQQIVVTCVHQLVPEIFVPLVGFKENIFHYNEWFFEKRIQRIETIVAINNQPLFRAIFDFFNKEQRLQQCTRTYNMFDVCLIIGLVGFLLWFDVPFDATLYPSFDKRTLKQAVQALVDGVAAVLFPIFHLGGNR